jgi:hypothetical protein
MTQCLPKLHGAPGAEPAPDVDVERVAASLHHQNEAIAPPTLVNVLA